MFSDQAVVGFRWLLEELRVSLFAQQLKTPVPVSLQRVMKEWATINHNQYPMLS
jgi:ATP-dependent helicase HrpA